MLNRCPATDTVTVHDEGLTLQCTVHAEDPEGRHAGDHYVELPPALGGRHTWINENPALV